MKIRSHAVGGVVDERVWRGTTQLDHLWTGDFAAVTTGLQLRRLRFVFYRWNNIFHHADFIQKPEWQLAKHISLTKVKRLSTHWYPMIRISLHPGSRLPSGSLAKINHVFIIPKQKAEQKILLKMSFLTYPACIRNSDRRTKRTNHVLYNPKHTLSLADVHTTFWHTSPRDMLLSRFWHNLIISM